MKADFEKGTKVCSKCKRELPISEFYKNKCMVDGLKNQCKECEKTYRKSKKGKQMYKRSTDKNINTFGNVGHTRGRGTFVKRDYELTKEQYKRREKSRRYHKHMSKRSNPQGILVWNDGLLNNYSVKEYRRELRKEYNRQRMCAIRGYVGKVKPSEHFLFDFDLEQMLKDNVYCGDGKYKYYITKWWKGTIRHWTVNDGIWRK